MSRTVWTFPGQLTEYVGMTGGFLEGSSVLRESLAAASDLLGHDLARLCREGPEEMLRRDDNAGMAVVAVGYSAAKELRAAGFRPDALLGYSLGFYTAAAASGAISLDQALRIVLTVAREGEHFASEEMSMGFVTGLRVPTLEAALEDVLARREIAITNINSRAQIVLAGRVNAVEEAIERVRPHAIHCERLPICRPYHSPWMAPVADRVEDLGRTMEIMPPSFPLFDHREGSRLESVEALRERLSGQLCSRLDWNASISRLVSQGFSLFVEMPPGRSTTRMVRWIDRDVTALSLDDGRDRERFLTKAVPPRHAAP